MYIMLNCVYLLRSTVLSIVTNLRSRLHKMRQSRFEWKTPLNLLNPLIPVGLSILGKQPSQDF